MALVRLTLGVSPDLADALAARLFSAGASGIEEGPSELSVYAEEGPALDALVQAASEFRTEFDPDDSGQVSAPELSPVDMSWQDAWKTALVPTQVTRALTFRPTHHPDAPQGERTLWFIPEEAFGSGDHPTSRLVAQALEDLTETRAPGAALRLLDVGCGSGVLSLVALTHGFQSAVAVDIDEVSVRSTQENAKLNQLEGRLDCRLGSAGDVSGTFDVVAANIISTVLTALSAEVAARVAPGGTLLLSGLLESEQAEVAVVYAALGLTEVKRTHLDGWGFLEMQRPA